MKIVLLANGFTSWGGGIDCIKFYINALLEKCAKAELELYLLIPEENEFILNIKNQLRPFKNMLIDFLNGKRPYYVKSKSVDKQIIKDAFKCYDGKLQVIFYPNNSNLLLRKLKYINPDAVIPAIASLGRDFPYPWVGYLYDFQHKYYPDLFTSGEIARRDKHFAVMLNEAKAVIVNARDVKHDIFKYYPQTKTQVYNLPFAPIPREEWFLDEDNVDEIYTLPKNYFMISNQFWVHKAHGTAFEALALLEQRGIDNYEIVCTGNTYDYRFPNYFNELTLRIRQLGLSNKIRFLGYIPKEDQIQIMRKAVGVLQPTLFEGGPGGGASYDAIALGIPVVLSDIPVNKEIEEENVLFFKLKSPEDMADKMEELIRKRESNELVKPNKEVLLLKGNERLDMLGDRLLEAINYVISVNK